MLPEKKQNLIIGLVSIFIIIAIVLIIAFISNYIKNKDNKERKDLAYINEYEYVGVLKNEANFYEIYGINDKEENLDIKTLYEVKDINVLNNHIVFYSDATNEVRYDGDSFYLYELNTYYTNGYNVSLNPDYIILNNDKNLLYFKYNQDFNENITVTDSLVSNKILVNNNLIYYILEDGIYEYNIDSKENKNILESKDGYSLLNIDKTHLYINSNDGLLTYNINEDLITNFSDMTDNARFIDITDNGFLYLDNTTIKEYAWNKTINNNFDIKDTIVNSKRLDNNLYFMTLNNNNGIYKAIVDIESKTVKKLENNYINILKVR